MLYIGLFLLEMYILYLLANKVNNYIFHLFKKILKSTKISMYIMSLILLPGTFLHETAHLLSAKILLVPVNDFSLKPKLIKNNIVFGYVEIIKPDILRSFLIGCAPVIFGLAIMYAVFYFMPIETALSNIWIALIMLIFIFQISNTMFSSKKDMEGAIILLTIAIIFILLLYFFKEYLPLSGILSFLNNPANTEIFRQISLYLLIPIITNSIFVFMVNILLQ